MKTLATLLALLVALPATAQEKTLADLVVDIQRSNKAIQDRQDKADARLDKIEADVKALTQTAAPASKAEPKKMVSTCPGCACGCVATGECVCAKMAKAAVPAAPVEWTRYSYDGGQTWTTVPPAQYQPTIPMYLATDPNSYGFGGIPNSGNNWGGYPRGRLFGGRGAGGCSNGSCR